MLMLLHTVTLVRPPHHTKPTDAASAHGRGRAVEIRGTVTSQAGWHAGGETAPTFFLRRTLFFSLYAARFAVQCEATLAMEENMNIWKKLRIVECTYSPPEGGSSLCTQPTYLDFGFHLISCLQEACFKFLSENMPFKAI